MKNRVFSYEVCARKNGLVYLLKRKAKKEKKHDIRLTCHVYLKAEKLINVQPDVVDFDRNPH